MEYRAECSSSGEWTVWTRDGGSHAWRDFTTGPLVLDAEEIARITRRLLGHGIEGVTARARAELVPLIEDGGPRPPAVLMHSATATTHGFEGDLTDVAQGRSPYDVAGYLETRVVSLAAEGDVAVGRTVPWREAVEIMRVLAFNIGDLDHYYLVQALLVAADRFTTDPHLALVGLIGWLRAHDRFVIRLYALDLETQVFLCWLREQVGRDVLYIDANAPVVAQEWNRKNGLHPTVAAARNVTVTEPVDAVLAAEQERSLAATTLGMALPVLPGYRAERGDSPDSFVAQVLEAARLLQERHGVMLGCLKACEAGDGARIVCPLELTDTVTLERHTREAHPHGDDYLLEAYMMFPTFVAGGREFITAPSGHIRGGHVVDGLTVQLMRGSAWEGNTYVDARTAASVGISDAAYAEMVAAMQTVRDGFHGELADAAGCSAGLATGGVDFAIGQVGGHHVGESVGIIDLNLSSHGAEYMRAFHEEVRQHMPDAYVATRVFRPTAQATLAASEKIIESARAPGQEARMVACVAQRWGMVAATAVDTIAAAGEAIRLVGVLEEHGLALAPEI